MTMFLKTAFVLALFVAVPLSAQPPSVKPGPEHEKLKESEGTWDATIKGEKGDSKGVLMCKIDLNGLWLLEHFSADLGGMKFEGRGATSYDPAKKKYVNVWIDTMATFPMVTEGTYNEKTKTLVLKGDMPTPDGKTVKCTLTTVSKDANTKTFVLNGVVDGKDFEMVNITYKRRPLQ